MAKKKQGDQKLLETAKKRYKRARDFNYEERQAQLDDLKFSILFEQWPEAIKQSRENDPNGPRPCLVVDKINQYVRQVVNDIRQNRPSLKARGVNNEADYEVAEKYQGLLRHIEQRSRAAIAYDWAAELAVRCGLGYFRVKTDYISQDSFEQEICIDRVLDNDSVTVDEISTQPDGSDYKWGIITEAMLQEDFEAAFPNAEKIDFETDREQEWFGDKKVVVADYYYLEEQEQELLALADGSSILREDYNRRAQNEEMPEIIKSRKVTLNQCMWAKLNGKQVLEKGTFPARYIPIFPVIGNEGFVSGRRQLSGIIRSAKDPQRQYNYTRSAFTEMVTLAPKAPYIAAAGQIEEFAEWEDANIKNYSVLRYKPIALGGTVVGSPQRQPFAGIPAGLQQDMNIAEQDIQSAMGMYKASLGQESNEKSGRAILARQKEGDTSTFHYSDNMGRTLEHLGRVLIQMIPQVYDTQRVIRIIGEDGTEDFAHIDPDQPQAVAETVDEDGSVKKIYNLGVGVYDVAVTVGPSYNTKRMEAADAMTQILQGNPDLMKVIGDLYFKSLDMPFSEEIAKRLKALLPPQIASGGDEKIPPQIQQKMQQLEQALQNASSQMDQAESKIAEYEQSKEIDFRKVKVDEYKAKTERMKALAPTFGPQEIQAVVVQTLEEVLRNPPPPEQRPMVPPMIQQVPMEQPPPQMMEQPPQQMMQPDQPPEGGFFSPEQIPQSASFMSE